MAVYVFDVNYTLKSGVEERDWVAKIAAFTQKEAIDKIIASVGKQKIARINSIGRECPINEFSDQLRKALSPPQQKQEVVNEVKWVCPYTEKEFKTAAALKSHFTRMGMKPQENTDSNVEKTDEEFQFEG